MNKEIVIYTDGASKGNPGPGGYGCILTLSNSNYKKEFFDGFRLTTNNRMELLAVIVALQNIKDSSIPVRIISDSKYVVDAINLKWIYGWKKNGFTKPKNPDLWKQLMELISKFSIKFEWIKGHNGHPMNERADQLAVMGAELKNKKIDTFYENNSDKI